MQKLNVVCSVAGWRPSPDACSSRRSVYHSNRAACYIARASAGGGKDGESDDAGHLEVGILAVIGILQMVTDSSLPIRKAGAFGFPLCWMRCPDKMPRIGMLN